MTVPADHEYLCLAKCVEKELLYTVPTLVAAAERAGLAVAKGAERVPDAERLWETLLEKARPQPDFWVVGGECPRRAYYGATIRMVYQESVREYDQEYLHCRTFLQQQAAPGGKLQLSAYEAMRGGARPRPESWFRQVWHGFSRPRPAWFLAGASALFFLAAGPFAVKGFKLLNQNGPGKAVQHLEGAAARGQLNPEQRFQLAWSYYIQGDMDRARALANQLVKEPYLRPATYGDTFYLLAQLARRRGEYPRALEYLDLAAHSYVDPAKHRDVAAAKADVYIKIGNYEAAVELLEETLAAASGAAQRGDLCLLLSDLHFWTGDWELSYDYNRQAREAYLRLNNVNGLSLVKLNQAWLAALGDRLDLAEHLAAELETELRQSGDENRLYYLDATWLLIQKRAAGTSDPLMMSRLKERAARDADLGKYLAFIEADDGSHLLQNVDFREDLKPAKGRDQGELPPWDGLEPSYREATIIESDPTSPSTPDPDPAVGQDGGSSIVEDNPSPPEEDPDP